MKKLGWPTLMCNELVVGENGEIVDFTMRLEDSKLNTVKALQQAGFETIAAGDSFNDLGMIRQSKAGFLHDSVAGMAGVRGNNADVSGDHISFQVLGQVNNPLGFFDELGIQLLVAEAVAKVAAESGKYQTVILHFPQQVPTGLGGQIFGGVFAVGGVHLNAVGTHGGSLGNGSASVKPEGLQNDTDGELVHKRFRPFINTVILETSNTAVDFVANLFYNQFDI
jgi:hypothetical protein